MFQLRVGPFHNGLGLTENGNCCMFSRIYGGTPCSAPCRTFLRVCLSHYQTDIPEIPLCSYGLQETAVLKRELDQNHWTSASLLDIMNFPFDGAWPVRMSSAR